MLLGNALGDAYGFGIEMQDAYWIRETAGFDAWPDNPFSLPDYVTPRGFYSDDAEMTLALARSRVD